MGRLLCRSSYLLSALLWGDNNAKLQELSIEEASALFATTTTVPGTVGRH